MHLLYFLRNANITTDIARKPEIIPTNFFVYGSCNFDSGMVFANWALYTRKWNSTKETKYLITQLTHYY